MIEVRDLHKRFKQVEALRGVSLQARNGAITGLLGHNGAGKTTTLRILYGLLRAEGGSACVDGIDVLREPQRAQALIGVMTDAHGLYPRLTAREHIAYFARLRGLDRRVLETRSAALLEKLGMQEIADRRAQGFSQGERMKVSLARALVHDPGNVLLDEPTNGLDVMTTRSVRAILQELKAQNKCVLLSSHIMQEVGLLCDEVVVIAEGRVLMQGSLDELLSRSGAASVEEAFMNLTEAP